MNVYPDNLTLALERKLLPVYLITGDEPLQMMEAADEIRAACRQAGYTDSERYQVDNARSFDWQALAMAGQTMSLFGDKKVINLHIPSGKPGTEGAASLKKWCEAANDDTILIITGGRPEGRFQNSAWFKAIDKIGVTMQVWPLSPQKTSQWIQARLKAIGISADAAAVELLTERVEGNLLAARQEIEKLAILYSGQSLGARELLASVTDSSRYTILDLIEAALSSDAPRAVKVLESLKAGGEPAVLICWHLSSEVRKITAAQARMDKGESQGQAMLKSGIWKNRQSLVARVLRERPRVFWLRASADCSYLDRLSKGMASGDLWIEIGAFVTRLSGTRWPLIRSADIA
ncbi:DNA polymerase III subunit delta [Chromatiales bacterium (ex Bugula neritina AB1)]|nr:DNA polymerase III subunit delta [Chromatiales bacterium (ex Bugula neritina AB1)]